MTKKLFNNDLRYPVTEWRSSGREPWVYEARTPGDLLGVHAELITSSLLPEEELRYLLYSPIWDGTWAPFGISAQPASHALAVTNNRFLLSRNLHRDDAEPTVFSIPFEQVLWAECGNAILLGWFSLYSILEDGPGRISVLFKSTGEKFFTAALRRYRQTLPRQDPTAGHGKGQAAWQDLWNRVNELEACGVRPLLLEDEMLMGWLRAGQKWRYRRKLMRWRPECESPENLLLWTSTGVIHVIQEPDIRPEIHSFGLTVRSVPWDAIQLAEVMSGGTLRLTLERDKAVLRIEVPFDKEYRDQADSLARSIERKSPL
jgi:hypothetical protein